MVVYFHPEGIFYGFLDALYPGITEFYDLCNISVGTGFINDQVVMLFVEIRFFVGRRGQGFLPELVFADESCIQKDLNGIVDGGLAHMIFLIDHKKIKVVHIKMVVHIVNLLQYGIPFGRVAVRFIQEVLLENFLDDAYVLFFLGGIHGGV